MTHTVEIDQYPHYDTYRLHTSVLQVAVTLCLLRPIHSCVWSSDKLGLIVGHPSHAMPVVCALADLDTEHHQCSITYYSTQRRLCEAIAQPVKLATTVASSADALRPVHNMHKCILAFLFPSPAMYSPYPILLSCSAYVSARLAVPDRTVRRISQITDHQHTRDSRGRLLLEGGCFASRSCWVSPDAHIASSEP